jgi:hypothetical protein
VATETLVQRQPRPGLPASSAIFATGTLAALTFALEKGWLTIGLALMSPGAAWVAEKRTLPRAALACRHHGRGDGRPHRL